jgi:flagellar assembly factor FliW
MEINTSRFGPVRIDPGDILHFPAGLLGLEECRQWVLLSDGRNGAVAWLQSVERPKVALAVVSPRRFVPDYRMRVASAELEPLGLADVRAAEVLVIVGRTGGQTTLNLKAPLVINPATGAGRQVLTNGDLPVAHAVPGGTAGLKKSA